MKKKNEMGFAMVAFVGFLPALLSAVLCLYVLIGLFEDRTAAQNSCRRALLGGLEKAALSMKSLLDLNPLAAILEGEKNVAVAALAAAVASGNPASVTAATLRLNAVLEKQKSLGTRQKFLYELARAQIAQTQLEAFSNLQKQPLGFLKNLALPPKKVLPALRPTNAGLAPVYVLDQPFEEKQTLAQRWQLRLNFEKFKEFFKARSDWKEICAATLIPQGDRWRAHLSEVKF